MRTNRANAAPAPADPQPLASNTGDRAALIDGLLPQTQCRRCGFDGCRPYAEAIAQDRALINRCPPGGGEVIAALAELLGTAPIALDPTCGTPQPRRIASIDNDACIGCTKCILACPVDAIVGGPKHQHHVLADRCTGCDLCLPPCPVDCITMIPIRQEWTDDDAQRGRRHHRARLDRMARLARPAAGTVESILGNPSEKVRRLATVLERARSNARR